MTLDFIYLHAICTCFLLLPGSLTVSIGLQIKLVRVKRGITTKKLAKQVSITPEYLSQIENDRAPGVSVKVFARLCHALDVSPNEMMEWEQESEASALTRLRP